MLRHWLEVRSVVAPASGYNPAEGYRRDARASLIWAATVACAVERCPANPRREAWERHLARVFRRAEAQLAAHHLEVLQRLALPGRAARVPLGEAWALIDGEASAVELEASLLARLWERGARARRDAQEARRRHEAWLALLDLVEGSRSYGQVVAWLGTRFYRAGQDDPSFLSHGEVEDR